MKFCTLLYRNSEQSRNKKEEKTLSVHNTTQNNTKQTCFWLVEAILARFLLATAESELTPVNRLVSPLTWFSRGCLHDIVWLSYRYELIPVPSRVAEFVYMIPGQNLLSLRAIPVRDYLRSYVPDRDSHSGTKTLSVMAHGPRYTHSVPHDFEP